MTRKTSLLRKIEPIARRSSFANRIIYNSLSSHDESERRNDSGDSEGSRSCPHDPAWIDLLFTMSKITQIAALVRAANAERCFRGRMIESRSAIKPSGGARRDRTDDLMLAKHALSQLSYGPVTRRRMRCTRSNWWAWEDLNFRPHAYQARALTN